MLTAPQTPFAEPMHRASLNQQPPDPPQQNHHRDNNAGQLEHLHFAPRSSHTSKSARCISEVRAKGGEEVILANTLVLEILNARGGWAWEGLRSGRARLGRVRCRRC